MLELSEQSEQQHKKETPTERRKREQAEQKTIDRMIKMLQTMKRLEGIKKKSSLTPEEQERYDDLRGDFEQLLKLDETLVPKIREELQKRTTTPPSTGNSPKEQPHDTGPRADIAQQPAVQRYEDIWHSFNDRLSEIEDFPPKLLHRLQENLGAKELSFRIALRQLDREDGEVVIEKMRTGIFGGQEHIQEGRRTRTVDVSGLLSQREFIDLPPHVRADVEECVRTYFAELKSLTDRLMSQKEIQQETGEMLVTPLVRKERPIFEERVKQFRLKEAEELLQKMLADLKQKYNGTWKEASYDAFLNTWRGEIAARRAVHNEEVQRIKKETARRRRTKKEDAA